jgi:hypothetical protein
MRMRAQQMPQPGQPIWTAIVRVGMVVIMAVPGVMPVPVLACIRVLVAHGVQADRTVGLPHLDMP